MLFSCRDFALFQPELKKSYLKPLKRPLPKVDTKRKFDPIVPETGDWPVVQLSRNKKEFIEQVASESLQRIKVLRPGVNALVEELELTRYKEQLRYKTNPWKVDPEDEITFWEGVKQQLVEIDNLESAQQSSTRTDAVLEEIIFRYASEIAGNFKPSHYRLARRIANFGFSRMLNAAMLRGWDAFLKKEYTLQDKIQIVGEVDQLRNLASMGTIVMVPTHFSNLDSVTLGWAINELGLPPFIYGAGLNLFNISIFAYFMNSLGAYKVDRRKKNLIYLETLRTYSKQAIQRGCHSLFFPGGTRSRSGKIEDRLKLGLLGTAIEAQRANYLIPHRGRKNKIFVVPVVINYNFVLEAPSLIRNYLESSGQERYYTETDEFSTSYAILSFLLKFFTKGSHISLSIGRGMDLFGNYVDEKGKSIDINGHHVNTRDYFLYKGEITYDAQREEEYTRMLSNKIVTEYHRINQVLPSHLAPFVAFRMLRRRYQRMDLYSFLRLPVDEIEIGYEEYKLMFDRVRNRIFELYDQGKLNISASMVGDVNKVIDEGVYNVGLYHTKRPLIKNRKGNIITQDLSTLYYYHNRMDGYELEKLI